MRNYFKRIARRFGYELRPYQLFPPDVTPAEAEIYRQCDGFTMTSIERLVTLTRSVEYLVRNSIAGAFVECGVWRGGSMMAVALTLRRLGATDRQLYLYDTFTGMAAPSGHDRRYDGRPAAELLAGASNEAWIRACADLADVKANLASTGYPMDQIRFIQGKVEDTIPAQIPTKICLLRLDTDWYESTRHELVHLYPRLARHGVLIIDDYGHWRGAREATDEFFRDMEPAPFLNRVDYTARLVVKV